ncbi:MAG: hypothetical protein RIG77_08640 [Cyclobacteriaceae bacterium]
MKNIALSQDKNGSFHISGSQYETFLGEGFFNTLDDISSIASTVGSVKNSLSGGSKTKAPNPSVKTPPVVSVSPSPDSLELEKLKLQLQAQALQNQRLLSGNQARNTTPKKDNTLLYVGLGVGGLVLVAVLVMALK